MSPRLGMEGAGRGQEPSGTRPQGDHLRAASALSPPLGRRLLPFVALTRHSHPSRGPWRSGDTRSDSKTERGATEGVTVGKGTGPPGTLHTHDRLPGDWLLPVRVFLPCLSC